MPSHITACFKCCNCGCEKVIHGTYEKTEDEFRNYKWFDLFSQGWTGIKDGRVKCSNCSK